MKLRESIRRDHKLTKSVEVLVAPEPEEPQYFNYHKDFKPKVQQALEERAQLLVKDLSSDLFTPSAEAAFAAKLFLDSIHQPVPVDSQKVLRVAQEWQRAEDRLFPVRNYSHYLGQEWLRRVAEFVNLNQDARTIFQARLEAQEPFIAPSNLAKADENTRRTSIFPAMILYPESRAEYLGLQATWAPQEIARLEKTMRSGHYFQDSEYWRLIDDIACAPGYLPEWRRVLGQFFEDKKEAMNFGLKPRQPGERFGTSEVNLIYPVLVGQLLNGLRLEVDPQGKARLVNTSSKLRVANPPLPERVLA